MKYKFIQTLLLVLLPTLLQHAVATTMIQQIILAD